MVKIAAVSDLHGCLPDCPECDVLVVAGDIGPPTRAYHKNTNLAEAWIYDIFLEWTQSVPAKEVVFIAGNHDFVFQNVRISLPRNVHYLLDSGIELFGKKFWGSPWTPRFGDWAFMSRDQLLECYWDQIPGDTDILITHGPPLGTGDGDSLGCQSLAERVENLHLDMHFFGHIHESGGHSGDNWANVSYLNERYIPTNPIRVFDI